MTIYCGWNTDAIRDRLLSGLTVTCRPACSSMAPLIRFGDLVTLAPASQLKVGQIVFCRLLDYNRGLRIIRAIEDNKYQISNNMGKGNGWLSSKFIYGKVTKVEHGQSKYWRQI